MHATPTTKAIPKGSFGARTCAVVAEELVKLGP